MYTPNTLSLSGEAVTLPRRPKKSTNALLPTSLTLSLRFSIVIRKAIIRGSSNSRAFFDFDISFSEVKIILIYFPTQFGKHARAHNLHFESRIGFLTERGNSNTHHGAQFRAPEKPRASAAPFPLRLDSPSASLFRKTVDCAAGFRNGNVNLRKKR